MVGSHLGSEWYAWGGGRLLNRDEMTVKVITEVITKEPMYKVIDSQVSGYCTQF